MWIRFVEAALEDPFPLSLPMIESATKVSEAQNQENLAILFSVLHCRPMISKTQIFFEIS